MDFKAWSRLTNSRLASRLLQGVAIIAIVEWLNVVKQILCRDKNGKSQFQDFMFLYGYST